MQVWQVIGLTGLLLASAGLGSVQAQYFNWPGNHREVAQERRIERGVASGALTPQEARKLNHEQRRLDAMEDRMRADGRFTPRERAKLDRMQDKAGRHIYREMHDRQVAYPGYRQHQGPQPRHWRDNHHRPPHPGFSNRPQHHRGPQYSGRPHRSAPPAATRPHHRDRRLAFGH